MALALSGGATFRQKTTGFERVEFVYNALPEMNFSEITTKQPFLHTTLACPFIITGMTGGYPDAEKINGALAEAANTVGVALGVGSMRAALEAPHPDPSYTVVQRWSSRVPIIANLGAVQVAAWHTSKQLSHYIQRAIDMVGASALAIHLNPLQELLQPEGEPRFGGVLEAIEHAVAISPVPIIVKEVGAGLSRAVAEKLARAGVTMLDVAGAGGTSWAGIEILRRADAESQMHLWDVGIPTAESLQQCLNIVPCVIASGGITTGTDAAKAIAMGAMLAGTARPMLEAYSRGGLEEIVAELRKWELQLRQWMFLTGCSTLELFRTSRTTRTL